MNEPTLDDLRVLDLDDEFNDEIVPRPLTAAEFDRIATERGYVKETALVKRALDIFYEGGWVKRPVCGECEGKGEIPMREDTQADFMEPCPSCGGSGFGRLVALDGIDVGGTRLEVAFCIEHQQPTLDNASHCPFVYWVESRHSVEQAASEASKCRVTPAVLVLAAIDGGQE